MFIAMAAATACVWSGVLTVTASIDLPSLSSISRKSVNFSALVYFSAALSRRLVSTSQMATMSPCLGGVAGVAFALAADADAAEADFLVG